MTDKPKIDKNKDKTLDKVMKNIIYFICAVAVLLITAGAIGALTAVAYIFFRLTLTFVSHIGSVGFQVLSLVAVLIAFSILVKIVIEKIKA